MATIKDVAKKAGVSVATVSHILNSTRFVSDELRLKVNNAIKDLNYIPDSLAGSLRSKKTNTIGLVIPENTNPFFAEITTEIENILFSSGYSVIVCYTAYNFQKELKYLNVLRSKKVDGLIIIPTTDNPFYINQLIINGLPVVVIDRILEDIKTDMVLLNDYRGIYNVTNHLIKLGHERIAYIDRPYDLPHSLRRLEGYKKALEESKIAVNKDLIIKTTFGMEGGVLAVQKLFEKSVKPTAIVSFNDILAIGVLSGIYKKGLKVPDDISVTGFDDTMLSAFTIPPLTTLHFPKKKMAEIAISLLKKRMDDKINRKNKKIILELRLVIRESTGEAR